MFPSDTDPILDLAVSQELRNDTLCNKYLAKARFFVEPQDFRSLSSLASISDNIDQAFEYLQKAKLSNQLDATWMNYDPNFEWIRNDPRFRELFPEIE